MLTFHFQRKYYTNSCQVEYLTHEFLYSKNNDVTLFCALFVIQKSVLSQKGYSKWHNILEKGHKSTNNSYHETAMADAFGLIERFEFPESTLPMQTNSTVSSKIATYP